MLILMMKIECSCTAIEIWKSLINVLLDAERVCPHPETQREVTEGLSGIIKGH